MVLRAEVGLHSLAAGGPLVKDGFARDVTSDKRDALDVVVGKDALDNLAVAVHDVKDTAGVGEATKAREMELRREGADEARASETNAGNPASEARWARMRDAVGVAGDGLRRRVLPVRRASGMVQSGIMAGKLKGAERREDISSVVRSRGRNEMACSPTEAGWEQEGMGRYGSASIRTHQSRQSSPHRRHLAAPSDCRCPSETRPRPSRP